MRAYIPNKYHVLDQDYKFIGTVISTKSLEDAMQKGKALILSKRSLSCPHPILISDRKVAETNGAILSSPLIETNLSSVELQHSTGSKESGLPGRREHKNNVRKPFQGKSAAMAGKKAPRKQMGA